MAAVPKPKRSSPILRHGCHSPVNGYQGAKGLAAPTTHSRRVFDILFYRSQWAQHLHYMGCGLVSTGTWSAHCIMMTRDVAVSLLLLCLTMITLSQPNVGMENGLFLGDLPVKHCQALLSSIAVLDYQRLIIVKLGICNATKASPGAAMLQLESGMTQDEINKCSLAASNAPLGRECTRPCWKEFWNVLNIFSFQQVFTSCLFASTIHLILYVHWCKVGRRMYGKGRMFSELFTDACWILLAFSRFDCLTWQAIAPSKANVQAVAIRGAGPADKITVQGLNRLDSGRDILKPSKNTLSWTVRTCSVNFFSSWGQNRSKWCELWHNLRDSGIHWTGLWSVLREGWICQWICLIVMLSHSMTMHDGTRKVVSSNRPEFEKASAFAITPVLTIELNSLLHDVTICYMFPRFSTCFLHCSLLTHPFFSFR